MLDEARRDADALRAERARGRGRRTPQAERERAKREIERREGRDPARRSTSRPSKLAALMSEKALARQVSVEDHRRLLDESLAELKRPRTRRTTGRSFARRETKRARRQARRPRNTWPLPTQLHDTVLEAGSAGARGSRSVYAEALLGRGREADAQVDVDRRGTRSTSSPRCSSKDPAVEAFLASPAVGKKAKAAVLDAALPGRASDLLRGLVRGPDARTTGSTSFRGIAAAYRQLLDERAGRVPVKVTTAAALSDAQQRRAHRDARPAC